MDPETGEFDLFMQKAVLAYMEITEKYKGKDVWSFLPSYFSSQTQKLLSKTHPLHSFLSSKYVKYPVNTTKESVYCNWDLFSSVYKLYCESEFNNETSNTKNNKSRGPTVYKLTDMDEIGILI